MFRVTLVTLFLRLIRHFSFELGGEKKTKGAAIQFVSVDYDYCSQAPPDHLPSERIWPLFLYFIVSLVQTPYDTNPLLLLCTIHNRLSVRCQL